ncbi:hypothetical protein Pelo_7516 [Pelomyxa schiedti]|nr:hypothetical protein Pelo_7516 [Pelomyxa schiedti]
MYLWGFVIAALVLLLTASLLAVSAATAPIDVDDGPNQLEQPFAAIGHRAHDYAHHMMSKFASRAMALATGVGASCGSADGTSCQQCMLNGECDWCESSATCVGRYDAYETCADTWIRASEDCWLLDVEPTCQPYGIGCTDLQAFNYDFHATTYDESCVYQSAWGPTDNDTCSRKCACSVGGLVREYGKFCSIGYFGCPGEQPCDALDLCCQMHDWCVTVESYTSCECGNMLHQCVTSLTEDDYLSSSCPDSMKRTAQDIAAETEAQILVECLNHQDFYSKCGPEVNCNGVGSCLFNGGCDCGANTGKSPKRSYYSNLNLSQVNTGLTTNGEGLTVNAFLTIIPNVVMTLALFAKRTVIPKLVTKLAFVIVLVLADAFQPIPGFSVSRWQRDTQVFINM